MKHPTGRLRNYRRRLALHRRWREGLVWVVALVETLALAWVWMEFSE